MRHAITFLQGTFLGFMPENCAEHGAAAASLFYNYMQSLHRSSLYEIVS